MGDAGSPPHEHRAVPWHQQFRGGTRDDRTVREVVASLPLVLDELDALGARGKKAAT